MSSNQYKPQQPLAAGTLGSRQGSNKLGQQQKDTPLPNGFSVSESTLLHEAIGLAGMNWFDGQGLIMAKKTSSSWFFEQGNRKMPAG